MNDLNHRAGVEEAYLVVRHLKLEGIAGQNRRAIMDEIDHVFGVDAVTFDEAAGVLNVAYDATHCSIDGIEAIIHKYGADISHDWWSRFKEDYYRLEDENLKDNATHIPWSWCCRRKDH